MARIVGVDIPNEKRIVTSLTYIFGIGNTSAQLICERAHIDPETKTHALTEDDARVLRTVIEKDFQIEGALRSEVNMNLQRLKDIGCFRGLRHRRGLPVRGQNTKNNARTRKGPKARPGAKKSSK